MSKVGHVTPSRPLLTYFFIFLSLMPPAVNLRAKFEVLAQTIPDICRKS